MNEVIGFHLIESFQWLQELKEKETLYQEELSQLVASCQHHEEEEQDSQDAFVDTRLKTIVISMLTSHLFLVHSILSLEDSDGLLVVNLVNWMSEIVPLYEKYIELYKLSPQLSDQELFLSRRPLVRIKGIKKLLDQLTKAPALNNSLKTSIESFRQIFADLLAKARAKHDEQRQLVAQSSISFDNVKNLDSMELTAANFQLSDIFLRGHFHMCLEHPQRIAKLEVEVELFALTSSRSSKPLVSSIAICSIEKMGRSLMFAPFRNQELKLQEIRNEFEFETAEGTIALVPNYVSDTKSDIVIRLSIKEISKFDQWNKIFNSLFSRHLIAHTKNEFEEKHSEALKNGSDGLDIKLLPLPVIVTDPTPKPTLLHKSKRINPSLSISQDLIFLRDQQEHNENHGVPSKASSPTISNNRVPLKETTNTIHDAKAHAYRTPNFQIFSQKADALKTTDEVEQELVIGPSALSSGTIADSPALKLSTQNTKTELPEKIEELSSGQTDTLNESTKESLYFVEKGASEQEILKFVDSEIENFGPPKLLSSLDVLQSHNGSTSSFLDFDALSKSDLQLSAKEPEEKAEKKGRRKSIFGILGFKKKTTSNAPSKQKSAELPPKETGIITQNNGSLSTLTTEETLKSSKNNKNINNLTLEIPKLSYTVDSLNTPSESIDNASISTKLSVVPAPFSMPEIESPTVLISKEQRAALEKSTTLCDLSCRVSNWAMNKWEIIGGKEINVKVVVGENGSHFIGYDEKESPLIVLEINLSTTIRRSTAVDVQLKTKDYSDPTKMCSTLIRCITGTQAETLTKTLELSKQELNKPVMNSKDSAVSLNSSTFSSLASSQSLLSKEMFNSMTSITNNSILTDSINLGKPRIGGSNISLISPISRHGSPQDLYFTPPTSVVDLSVSLKSSPLSTQRLLLLSSMKIRIHERVEGKWEPQAISALELYALESVPNLYHLKISEITVDTLVNKDNVLRVGKAGVLLSLPQGADNDTLEYMLEFKGKKLADEFFEIIGQDN